MCKNNWSGKTKILPTRIEKKLITSECLENVLTRKSYSTPVYLIKIFEIGPVALELGHFKDRVPNFFRKNRKSHEKKCISKIIVKSYGKSKNRNPKFRVFRVFFNFFQNLDFKISDFRIFRLIFD